MRTNVLKAYCALSMISAKSLDLLVDLIGIEPMTSSMPWKRAPNCATGPLSTAFFILCEVRLFVNGERFRSWRCLIEWNLCCALKAVKASRFLG